MKHVLSLGAGVQSSVLALMAAQEEITPMPDFAVFADTQAEPPHVYEWLKWLETKLPFPVHYVTKGNLTEESLKVKIRKADGGERVNNLIPFFGLIPGYTYPCLLYTSPSPRDGLLSRMPSSA